MVKNLQLFYHASVVLVLISGIVWQLMNLKEKPEHDRYIADIYEYGERYFTTWNFVVQITYFALVTFEDISEAKSLVSLVTRWKPYFFHSLVIPCSVIVFVVYWSLFYYDRELVFPEEADFYCMPYSNHVVHTWIIVFPILECFFIRNSEEVSFPSCFVGLTTLHVMYYSIFFYHYLSLGRFLYPLFGYLKGYQTAIVIFSIYIMGLGAAKRLGVKRKPQTFFRNPEETLVTTPLIAKATRQSLTRILLSKILQYSETESTEASKSS